MANGSRTAYFLAALGLTLAVGMWLSRPASALADTAPSITTQPQIGFVDVAPQQGSFTASADGTPAPTVRWEEASDRRGPWTAISGGQDTTFAGSTESTLKVTSSDSNLGDDFRAVFTNSAGTVATRPARLVSPVSWMHDLRGDIGDVPLTELTIPGTHDMGTYGMLDTSSVSLDTNTFLCGDDLTVCHAYGRAQSLDAHEELTRGIRYFDLRVCGQGGNPNVHGRNTLADLSQNPITCHGATGALLADILQETRQFVDLHPGEVVILDFNHAFAIDPDIEAQQIEQAFAVPSGCTPGAAGCGSLLIPPQYCTPGDANSGTCADGLTLNKIADEHLGNVIVNFEDDGGNDPWEPGCVDTDTHICPIPEQPKLDLAFYDRHKLLWGRADGAASTSHGDRCTLEAAFPSCFGNVDTETDALTRALETLTNRPSYIDSGRDTGSGLHFKRFFVQFLQTTPTAATIAKDLGQGSLFDEANATNGLIGPAVLGCGDTAARTGTCFAEQRPENINILALNFFEITDYAITDPPIHFDLAREAIAFNEYARTAPVVTISSGVQPAATGWYNAVTLGGQGHQLEVDVSAEDYKYDTGITALDCLDGANPLAIGFTGPTADSHMALSGNLGDGVHQLDCRATDGANQGLRGEGNRGAGPGSTPLPATFRVDTTPPVITCPTGAFLLNQPINTLDGTVTDATSGVGNPTASASISTSRVGSFTATLSATDIAGNTASKVCSYTVSYKVNYLYDTTSAWTSGSIVPIRVQLADYAGNNVGSASTTLTARSVTYTASGTSFAPSSPGATNPGMVFAFNPLNYLFSLNTKGYKPGAYTLDFTASGDPVTHHAPLAIR
jgi:hypothetical protein